MKQHSPGGVWLQYETSNPAERSQRLHHLYAALIELIIHEGRFVSERTNLFLVFNSILFTGLFVLVTGSNYNDKMLLAVVLGFLLSAIGLIMVVFHCASIARTIDSLDFWRSSIRLIEEDPDYWYPGKTLRDEDFDVFSARGRYWLGAETRQRLTPLRLGRLPEKWRRRALRLPEPTEIAAMWLPLLFATLWCLTLLWSGYHAARVIDAKLSVGRELYVVLQSSMINYIPYVDIR